AQRRGTSFRHREDSERGPRCARDDTTSDRGGEGQPGRHPEERSDEGALSCTAATRKGVPGCARDDTTSDRGGEGRPGCHPEERSDEGALSCTATTRKGVPGCAPR